MRLPETDSVSFSTETKKREDKGTIASKWWKKINVKLKFHPQTTLLENKRKRTHFTTYVKPT